MENERKWIGRKVGKEGFEKWIHFESDSRGRTNTNVKPWKERIQEK